MLLEIYFFDFIIETKVVKEQVIVFFRVIESSKKDYDHSNVKEQGVHDVVIEVEDLSRGVDCSFFAKHQNLFIDDSVKVIVMNVIFHDFKLNLTNVNYFFVYNVGLVKSYEMNKKKNESKNRGKECRKYQHKIIDKGIKILTYTF